MIRVENRRLQNMKLTHRKRGDIKGFSDSSRRRLARLLLNNAEKFKYFFTVTYRKNNRNCMLSKQHINHFLTRFRNSVGSGVGYVWVLEFQKRGAIHFHMWLEDVKVEDFIEWQKIEVRRNIQIRFKECIEDLNRFKYLTYLWLSVTKQLDDVKALKASTDLKSIYSDGFTFWYATKYVIKKGQKIYEGNIDELTGEIYSLWVGRFWGSSRSVKNEKLYESTNPKTVRLFRNWYKKFLGRRKHSGLRLILKPEEAERLSILCDDLDRAKMR
jgi:hypothetical protein